LIVGGAAFALAFYCQSEHVISGLEDNSTLPVVFENAINLTNNDQYSIYCQAAAWNSSVYAVCKNSPGIHEVLYSKGTKT